MNSIRLWPATVDPNVAVFLDGVYLQNPAAISLSLLDVERIEVVEGRVSALYGQQSIAVSIGGPLTERFQARAAAGHRPRW